MTFSGFLFIGLSFLCTSICCFFFSHMHISHTSPSALKQKTGFVFPGSQKLQGILSEMRQLLHTSNMSLPPTYFHTGWTYGLYYQQWRKPLAGADDGNTRAAELECSLPRRLSETDRATRGVGGDANTKRPSSSAAAASKKKKKMTGFLFTKEKRNARAGWSSAAFLTVWRRAREG